MDILESKISVLPPGAGRTVWVDGHPITWKATGDTTGGAMSVMEVSVPPKLGAAPHIHNRHDETYYILDGQFEFLLGSAVAVHGTGAFIHIPRGSVHAFTCVSNTWGRMLAIFTPSGMEAFFEDLSAISIEDAVRPEVQQRLFDEYGYETAIRVEMASEDAN